MKLGDVANMLAYFFFCFKKRNTNGPEQMPNLSFACLHKHWQLHTSTQHLCKISDLCTSLLPKWILSLPHYQRGSFLVYETVWKSRNLAHKRHPTPWFWITKTLMMCLAHKRHPTPWFWIAKTLMMCLAHMPTPCPQMLTHALLAFDLPFIVDHNLLLVLSSYLYLLSPKQLQRNQAYTRKFKGSGTEIWARKGHVHCYCKYWHQRRCRW